MKSRYGMLPGHLGDLLRQLGSEKALGHEKAQKAQSKEGFALAETLRGSVTIVSTPPFSFCGLCAFLWPSTAVFRLHCGFQFQPFCGGVTRALVTRPTRGRRSRG